MEWPSPGLNFGGVALVVRLLPRVVSELKMACDYYYCYYYDDD